MAFESENLVGWASGKWEFAWLRVESVATWKEEEEKEDSNIVASITSQVAGLVAASTCIPRQDGGEESLYCFITYTGQYHRVGIVS